MAKKRWVVWTDPFSTKKGARTLARMWRRPGSAYPGGVRVRATVTKKKASGRGRKTTGWSLFVRQSDIDRKLRKRKK